MYYGAAFRHFGTRPEYLTAYEREDLRWAIAYQRVRTEHIQAVMDQTRYEGKYTEISLLAGILEALTNF